jgi:hypothetical protein
MGGPSLGDKNMATSVPPSMRIADRSLAAICAATLPLCALVIWPVVEMGVCDEWSYAKTVQILARTGHVVYNGWATAILGWQLYLGALFVKLFGFSFTVIRLSMLPVAMATAWIAHRTLVRAGINQWNATVGVLVFVLSPLFLPLSVTFMTDVPGLFSIILCLYACLRALQADTDDASLRWLCFAAVSNALTGMVRQTSWLGVLIMVPSTLWLLRHRKGLLVGGAAIYLASIVFIYSVLRWFHHQPYSVPELLIKKSIWSPVHGMWVLLLTLPEVACLLLPVLLFFIPAVPFRQRRAVAVLSVCSLLVVAYLFVVAHRDQEWLMPNFWMGSYVSYYGIMYFVPPHGTPPAVLGFGVRLVLTCLAALSAISFLTVVLLSARRQRNDPLKPDSVGWRQLFVLFAPFTLVYFALLLPRATFSLIFDRYLLAPLFLALIVMLRGYQERVKTHLPAATLAAIALYAAFGIAGTHDAFAMRRAYLAAVQELRSAGVPPTAIDGGWEYNGWNQIELSHFINDPKIPVLPGDRFMPLVGKHTFGICRPDFLNEFAAIWPRYGLAVSPTECHGSAGFPPVQYHTWLAPHLNTLYIVKIGRPDQPYRPESSEGSSEASVAPR